MLLGKTNTSEFGHKALTDNPLFGPTRNPWNLDAHAGRLERRRGGGGGERRSARWRSVPTAGAPCASPPPFCGVVGFKPSCGRVPQHPAFPGWEHVVATGPITRTVRDAALVLDVIAGGDDRDRASLPARARAPTSRRASDGIAGLHVAWTPDLGYAAVDPACCSALRERRGGVRERSAATWRSSIPAGRIREEAFRTMVAAQFYAAWSDELPGAARRELDPRS